MMARWVFTTGGEFFFIPSVIRWRRALGLVDDWQDLPVLVEGEGLVGRWLEACWDVDLFEGVRLPSWEVG